MNQGIFLKVNQAAKEATIEITGVIGLDVWQDKFRAMLAEIGEEVDTVRFSIYSPGGDIWEGNGMISQIAALKQRTVAEVQVAASMATLIACACDEVRMAANGRWLVHNPWAATAGDADEMEKRAKELKDTEDEAVALYARKTGKTGEELRALMDEERWLTPEEAKEFGFVDTIDDPFNLAKYKEATKAMLAAKLVPVAIAAWAAEIAETEEQDDVASNTEGTEGTGGETGEGSGDPANPPALSPEAQAHLDKIEQRLRAQADAAYQEGHDAGIEEAQANTAAAVEQALAPLRAEVETLRAELDKAKKSAAEAAEAYKQSEAKVAEYDRRLATLAGGLDFHEEAEPGETEPPKTWEDAVEELGYAKARKQFPSLWETWMNNKK